MKYYIAYGSNLNITQMSKRCPGAIPVGWGMLRNWALVFRVHATIEPCDGEHVPVGIWEINDRDEAALDRYEGFPYYYNKQEITLTFHPFIFSRPKEITGLVYIMNNFRPIAPPSADYFTTIEQGYDDFGFKTHRLIRAMDNSFKQYIGQYDEDYEEV